MRFLWPAFAKGQARCSESFLLALKLETESMTSVHHPGQQQIKEKHAAAAAI